MGNCTPITGSPYAGMDEVDESEKDKNGVPLRDYSGKISRAELKKRAKTGAFVFCSGDSEFSKIIKAFTKTAYTHVAVIIKKGTRVFVLQAVFMTRVPYYDYLTKRFKKSGVMLNTLDDFLDEDQGKVYYKELDIGDKVINPIAQLNFLRFVKNKKYELNPVVLMSAPSRANFFPDRTAYFCSEVVYDFLYHMGLINKKKSTKNPQNIIPSDFVYINEQRQFTLNTWVKYKDMVKVKKDSNVRDTSSRLLSAKFQLQEDSDDEYI